MNNFLFWVLNIIIAIIAMAIIAIIMAFNNQDLKNYPYFYFIINFINLIA